MIYKGNKCVKLVKKWRKQMGVMSEEHFDEYWNWDWWFETERKVSYIRAVKTIYDHTMHKVEYDLKHCAYKCMTCDIWLEKKCTELENYEDDEVYPCTACDGRPEKPSEVTQCSE